ncbi:hypothetical protein GGP55_000733 [Salinibacter ruber]|uniref:HmuY family protein n=1 Tax=Salinibacter ruber TaxID=146919 RepID=UPI0021698618|nr:HmuY family protein [Salinibacter ruber]MCS3630158.1 hypothetical protein [Salinibacter ruber]
MRRISSLLSILLLGGALVLTGCDSSGSNGGGGEAVETKTVTDLPADPPQNTSGGGRPQGTGRHTFFSLEDDEIVLSYSNTTRADSNSTTWDLGFQSINVLVNNGQGGPGNAAAYVAEERFQDVDQANTDKLSTDDATDEDLETDWYNYNVNGNNKIRPEAGRTIVVRTADGDQYAKIRMDSYYKGAPDDLSESDAPSRYYTFDYVVSDDTSFE